MPPDRARSRAWTLACAALLVVAAAALHREVLFDGAVYHMDDAADGYYPGHIAVARAFANLELPTWERGSWCGWPLVVDPYNGVFYPPNVIYFALGAARGLGFAIVLHVLLGGAGVALLLRRRGLAVEIALFGAVAYALSSFGVVRIRHVIFVQMMGWLPWILVGVEGWCQTRRRRDLVLVAAATALALLAGALSIGHFAALVIGGYTVARTRRVGDLFALGGAAILGALIAAIQLAPTLMHLPHSPRSLGSDYSFASSYAWPTLRYLYTLVAPDVFGGENRARYVGAPNHWELAGWYVGALAVLLSPLALLRPRDDRRRGAELPVLLALVVLAIGLALGDHGPVHPFFFHHVPLYAALRCPSRALLMAVLALPLLGAHGAAALLDRARSPSRIARPIAATLLIAGAVIAWRVGKVAPNAPLAAQVWAEAWSHFAWVAGAGIALLVAAGFGGLPRRVAGFSLAALLAADLVLVGRNYVQPQPPDHPAGMERFAAVEWLLAHQTGDRFVNDPAGPFRLHNVGMVLDLENASGYDSVAIWRYVDFLHLLKNGHPYREKKLKHDFAGIGVHNLSSPLLDLMNVRWLIAVDPPDARWVERFRPTGPTQPASTHEPYWNSALKVFENTAVLPRAFVLHRAEVPGSDDRLAARLVDPAFDPSRVVLLEEQPPVALDAALPHTPAKVTLSERHRLVIEVESPAPGILFVGDAHYPGWSATVDGAAAPILRADWAFRGVPVGAGRHRVEMRYTSRPVQVGALLTLAGLALLAALAISGRRRGDGNVTG